MSKRSGSRPGVFSAGLRKIHFFGRSVEGKILATKSDSARGRRIQWLGRKHGKSRTARNLARKLQRCKPGRRCLSGACPVCSQAAQELFVELGRQLVAQSTAVAKKPLQAVAITLVPSGLTSKPGELGDLTVEQVHRRTTDRLAKAKVPMAIGVLEVGLVEHADGRYPPAWAWHLHGVALTRNPAALARRLKVAFRKTDAVPRPVRVTPWDGNSRWLRYCYKIEPRCRVGVDNQLRFRPRLNKARKNRGTKSRTLSPKEYLELLSFHGQISLDSRILTKGAQLRSTQRGGCQLVKLRSPKK